jgi:hypothetical protein
MTLSNMPEIPVKNPASSLIEGFVAEFSVSSPAEEVLAVLRKRDFDLVDLHRYQSLHDDPRLGEMGADRDLHDYAGRPAGPHAIREGPTRRAKMRS